jgi:UDP-N-acetylglucosamine transferase subunit ALG13
MVASSGGHLAQLRQLATRLQGVSEDQLWVTFDTVQSRSLLSGPEVVFVRRIHSRELGPTVANMGPLDRLLREHDVTAVVSTGSALALSAMVPARARRIPCHYIESAARSAGPSLTGKLLTRVPGVHRYTQYPGWEGGRWHYRGSVFDGFQTNGSKNGGSTNGRPASRVVVTLGTGKYGFRRLVERLVELLPRDAEVLWQTGATDTSGLPIDPTPTIPHAELSAAIARADLVVSHAGVGSALGALEEGRMPILVPRRAAHGEIVDDHQEQAARELADRGLAIMREADEFTREDLERATGSRVEPSTEPPVIELDPS